MARPCSEVDETRPQAKDRGILDRLPTMAGERAAETTATPGYEGQVRDQGAVFGDEEEEGATEPTSEPDAVPRSPCDDGVTMQAQDPKLIAAHPEAVDRRHVDQRPADRDASDALTADGDHVPILADRPAGAQPPVRAVPGRDVEPSGDGQQKLH